MGTDNTYVMGDWCSHPRSGAKRATRLVSRQICTSRDTYRMQSVRMARVIPEEVNVFYIPHLRMKQLVNVYLEQVN